MNSNKTNSTKETEVAKAESKPIVNNSEVNGLCIIDSSTKADINETRNKINRTNQTADNAELVSNSLNNGNKKISRAESVKNSKRYYKKSSMSQNRHPTTILPSYLPLKKYMVKDMNNMKPVRQAQREKKSTVKAPFSQRTGAHTAKNCQRNYSKETFEEFMKKVNNEKQYDNTYANKSRPYTSSGWGQVRIRTHKKPITKSNLGVRYFEEAKYNPYLK